MRTAAVDFLPRAVDSLAWETAVFDACQVETWTFHFAPFATTVTIASEAGGIQLEEEAYVPAAAADAP